MSEDATNTILGGAVLAVLVSAFAAARAYDLHNDAGELRWVYRIIFALLLAAILLGIIVRRRRLR